ncbi:IS5 family transposase, partial [Acidiplasma cupricumulans]|uniref:IS5 family transposase n=1 Tax=Acidiplasma cupricumulans TaxID=312540 RepID=UPI0009FEB78B
DVCSSDLDINIFNNWNELLKENNYNKKGRPFKIPGIIILYLAKLRELRGISFRQLETELHNLSKIFKFPKISFTSIYRRIRKIIPEIENDNNNVLAAIDSSGFKITLRGDYLENKWHRKRKGWLKLHAIININNFNIIDYSITNEHNNDAKEGIKIIKRIKNKIKKLYGDKGYDSKAIYNELEDKAIIPPRKNAVTLSKGSIYRAKITRFIRRFSEGSWKINNNYRLRWNVEIYFSGIKRLFGETIRAVKPENIVQEMMLKVYFYNEFNKLKEGYQLCNSYEKPILNNLLCLRGILNLLNRPAHCHC